MRMTCLAGHALVIVLFALPAAAQSPSSSLQTRELMGRAEADAQKRAGSELLRRTENTGRYEAMAPAAVPSAVPSLEGLTTRSVQPNPKAAGRQPEK